MIISFDGTGTPSSVVEREANYEEFIDLIPDKAYREYRLEFVNVVSDLGTGPNPQSGALLTVYLSTDGGATFHEGPNYLNTGISNFPGEANPNFIPPFALGVPQTLSMGCRLSVDTGDRVGYGSTGHATFYSFGTISGNPVHTTYFSHSLKGAIGGAAGVSLRPDGTPWFPGDAHGTPFHWTVGITYEGHFDGAPGQQVNGFRVRVDRTSLPDAVIRSGYFALHGMS